jgi:hypothetical protein
MRFDVQPFIAVLHITQIATLLEAVTYSMGAHLTIAAIQKGVRRKRKECK